MGELKVKEKEVVVPGDEVATGMDFLPSFGTYRDNDSIVASRLGLVNMSGKVIKIIPLSGKYIPKRGDTVVGKVTDILMSGWRVDINCPYSAVMNLKDAMMEYIPKDADLTKYIDIEEYVAVKIINVTSQKLVDITMKAPGLRKLIGGRIVTVNTNKIPRIIGKNGSMVSMIKNATNCKIMAGQNGWIWIRGEDLSKEIIAVEAIEMIERESHTSGLTERVRQYLEKATGTKIEIPQMEPQQEHQEGQQYSEEQQPQYGEQYQHRDQYSRGGYGQHRGYRR